MERENKRFLLSGGESGIIFTYASIASIIIAVIFSLAVMYIPMGEKTVTYLNYALPCVCLALIIFWCVRNNNLHFCEAVALKKFEKKYIIIALLLAVGALFSLSWINEFFIVLMENLFGYEPTPITLPKDNAFDFILCTLFVCVCPAFFEEVLFRGLILNGCKRLGSVFAVLLCGVLFSIYHKSPLQTVYQLIVGCLYALLVIKSGSIIPTIIIHFINNFYIVVFYFATPQNYELNQTVNVILTVIGTLFLITGIAWLILGCKEPIVDQKLNDEYAKHVNVREERRNFLVFALMGVVISLVIWISNLIAYIG